MDVTRFDDEMAKHIHAGRIREDFMSGVRSGVNGLHLKGSWDATITLL
jgi:hypothetical protein